MAGLSLFTPPASEPLTVAEAKLFARIDVTDDDALVTDLIAGARRLCEERRSWAYITQTWDFFLDAFPTTVGSNAFPVASDWPDVPNAFPGSWPYLPLYLPIFLPRAPVQSVVSVSYTKSDGTPIIVSASDYFVDVANTRKARIAPQIGKTWPTDFLRPLNGVAIRFVAGYGTAATSIPEHMRLAMKQLVAFWYQNRDAIGTIPDEINDLLSQTIGGFAYA